MERIIIVSCLTIFLCNLVNTADIAYIRSTITDHFSENRNHFVNKTNKDAAMRFIHDEFVRFGLETVYNNFTYDNLRPLQKNLAPTELPRTFTNVIGVLKGTRFGSAQDRIIAVGAHYDTVETSKGVDDNGAGVAAMLESARQVTQARGSRANTVIFASFDIEEYDLIGSQKMIETWVNPWLVRNYGNAAQSVLPHGVIVLDTVMEYNTSRNSQRLPGAFENLYPDTYASLSSDGFQGDFLTLIYREPTSDKQLAEAFHAAWKSADSEFEIESFPISIGDVFLGWQYLPDLYRSDHTSFWQDNIPAIFITDSANYRGDMQFCYHKMCDDLKTMLTEDNINFLGKTADTIVITINALSEFETSGSEIAIQSNWLLFLATGFVILLATK